MPTRIKPSYDLGPCRLNRASIEGICKLIGDNFNHATYEASDGVWEVYNAESAELLNAVSEHDRLDRFAIAAQYAEPTPNGGIGFINGRLFGATRSVDIVFDSKQAMLEFTGEESQKHWLEHFLIDFRRLLLRRPLWHRLLNPRFGNFVVEFSLLALTRGTVSNLEVLQGRYTEIILNKKGPDPLVEGIKTNLVSDIILIVGGIVLGWLAFWFFLTFQVNILAVFQPPPVPPATPLP